MRQYEAVVIFSSQLAGEKLEEVKRNVDDQVKKLGGKITSQRELGKRSFGYVIKKQREGLYCEFCFDLDPAKVSDLRKAFQLMDDILRASILIREERPQTVAPLQSPPASTPTPKPVRPAVTKPFPHQKV